MTDPVEERLRDDLDFVFDEAWRRLARGVADRRSGFHTLQIATTDADGPHVRTVVLRGIERGSRLIRIHTDARSPKAGQLSADPRVEVCAYDARQKLQIRLRGAATVAGEGPAAQAAWVGSAPGSRLCYRAAHGPGSPLTDPAHGDPTPEMRAADAEAGRENFRAVLIVVTRIDWLHLAASGHRRATFEWTGADWSAAWRAP
jgi:hypothetical protein